MNRKVRPDMDVRYCSVDRIEEDMAVLAFDDGEEVSVSLSEFGFSIEEGMMLYMADGFYHSYVDETERRRAEAALLLRKILNKNIPE